MPNQYTGKKAVALKAAKTEELKSVAMQSPVNMSSDVGTMARETLFKAQNRKSIVEATIHSFQSELDDLNKVISACEAMVSIIEEKNRPEIVKHLEAVK
jgi:predicted membrane chloride channel (bestrophin family)